MVDNLDANKRQQLKRKAVLGAIDEIELEEIEKRLDDLLGAVTSLDKKTTRVQLAVAGGGCFTFVIIIIIAVLLFFGGILYEGILIFLVRAAILFGFISISSFILYLLNRGRQNLEKERTQQLYAIKKRNDEREQEEREAESKAKLRDIEREQEEREAESKAKLRDIEREQEEREAESKAKLRDIEREQEDDTETEVDANKSIPGGEATQPADHSHETEQVDQDGQELEEQPIDSQERENVATAKLADKTDDVEADEDDQFHTDTTGQLQQRGGEETG